MVKTYFVLILIQKLIVAINRYKNQYSRGLVEDVYPLFSLCPLATNVVNLAGSMSRYVEVKFMYPCRSRSSMKYIVAGGIEHWTTYSIDVVQNAW